MNEPHVRLHVAERALDDLARVRRARRRWASARRCAARPTSPRASCSPSATSPAAAATASACYVRPSRSALRAAAPGPRRPRRRALADARRRGRPTSLTTPAVADSLGDAMSAHAPACARARARSSSSATCAARATGPADCASWASATTSSCARSATPPRRRCPTSARSSLVDPETGRQRARRHRQPPAARALRRRRRRGARAGRPRHPRRRRPPPRCCRPTRTGCGRSSSASPTGPCCDDIRMATRPARAARCCPARAAALALARRRRSRYAIRFSNVGVLAQVVRVDPLAVALRAARAAARRARRARRRHGAPQVDVSAERKQGTIVLALDRSGSMLAQDVTPDRMTASRKAAQRFVKNLPDGFARRRRLVLRLGRRAQRSEPRAGRRAARHRRASRPAAAPRSATRSSARSACSASRRRHARPRRRQGPRHPPALRRLQHAGRRHLRRPRPSAKRAGVPIYTIALGTPDGVLDLRALGQGTGTIPVPPDPEALKAIARETGGESFTALDESTSRRSTTASAPASARPRSRRKSRSSSPASAALLLLAAAALLLGTPEHHMTFADPYLLDRAHRRAAGLVAYVVFARRSRRADARRREPGPVAEPDAAPSRLAPSRAARTAAAGAQPAARRRRRGRRRTCRATRRRRPSSSWSTRRTRWRRPTSARAASQLRAPRRAS